VGEGAGEAAGEDVGRGRVGVGGVERRLGELVGAELDRLERDVDDEGGGVGDEEGAEALGAVDSAEGRGDGPGLSAVDL
jgi:hypothetical protein